MIAHKTTEFLIENFPDKRVDLFDERYTTELYSYLEEFFLLKEIIDRREEIREAFVDFFKDLGLVLVVFKGVEKIVVKIRPYEVEVDREEIISRAIDFITTNETRLLKLPPRNDLIIFNEKLLFDFFSIIEEFSPRANKREIGKEAVRRFFKLTEKDAIVFLQGQLFIRFFDAFSPSIGAKNLQPQEKSVGIGKEKRFNGLPKEELMNLKDKVFPQGFEPHLKSVLKMVFENGLDFTTISNEFYEGNHIGILQKSLNEFLEKKLNLEPFVMEGFVNFILRENFEAIHKELAMKLTELINKKAGRSEDFIKYYSGKVVVQEGGKYKLPAIEDAEGTHWKVPAMKTIIQQRFLNLDKLKTRAEGIKKVKESIKETESEFLSFSKSLEDAKRESEENERELDDVLGVLIEKRTLLKNRRGSQKKGVNDPRLEEEIESLSGEIRLETSRENELLEIRKRYEKEINTYNHKAISSKQHKETLEKKEQEDREKLRIFKVGIEDIEERYNSLIDAITKALLKRKKKID